MNALRLRGVRAVVLPKPGKLSAKRLAHERQDWFRTGRNWRAGIEGRISGRKRRHGLRRCRYHGTDGMERWVGFGILAHIGRQIARHHVAELSWSVRSDRAREQRNMTAIRSPQKIPPKHDLPHSDAFCKGI